jgi:hypothetical protein
LCCILLSIPLFLLFLEFPNALEATVLCGVCNVVCGEGMLIEIAHPSLSSTASL